MKRILFVFATLLFFVSGCGRDDTSSLNAPDISRSELLFEHNHQRGLKHVDPQLRSDSELMDRAQKWAEYMAGRNTFHHSRLGGTKFGWMGENIAMGQPNIESVMQAWMHSSGHRANILNRHYSHAGFGIARNANGTIYWCVQFGGN